jgi:DNA-binding NarL/FixJ family response regulator
MSIPRSGIWQKVLLAQELATSALLALAREEATQGEPYFSLKDREQEVLAYLAQGYTNKDIAQTLFLSVSTVEAHLHNVCGKSGVASRTEAALWAVNNGYGPPG